ncbi:MAG TPA: (2Fe-2S)-binding protein [Methylocella sp.]|nr:(2Fe-2S)-binding protein [Methylocella sp.]
MIVCSCNVLTDTEIKDVVMSGSCPRTPGAVYKCLGCSPNCGRCIATLRVIINEAMADTGPASPLCQQIFEPDVDVESLCCTA